MDRFHTQGDLVEFLTHNKTRYSKATLGPGACIASDYICMKIWDRPEYDHIDKFFYVTYKDLPNINKNSVLFKLSPIKYMKWVSRDN